MIAAPRRTPAPGILRKLFRLGGPANTLDRGWGLWCAVLLLKNLSRLIFVVLGCVHLCGGPQGLMQCVAWAGMLVSYSQEGTVAQAVENTFDGKHPCPLCLAIRQAEETQQERSRPARLPSGCELLKICKELIPLELLSPVPPVAEMQSLSPPCGLDASARRCAVQPPVPPPRRGAIA
jgi:hypothetical protein